VLAVNYFGVRDGQPWLQWRASNDCFLLEDHSQDPFSLWSCTSRSDYAFASLRKTLPIPDGALLWSPRGLPLPEGQSKGEGDWDGSALKMAAMMCKAIYLQGEGSPELKPYFRNLQFEGEQRLRSSRISSISPYSHSYVAKGIPEQWRQQRLDNANHLRQRIFGLPCAEPLFQSWPPGSVPFVFPLVFGSTAARDACQAHLRRNRIYCPVHWICDTNDAEALDLSGRILSLPVDQRYGRQEMNRLADVLSDYAQNTQAATTAGDLRRVSLS
jgi:hypothetical protein